jgi:hypothetical protein
MNRPVDFPDVLKAEVEEIRARRRALFPGQQPLPVTPAADHPYVEAHRVRPLGLAFSGGGIRSATFNLGVLQGLAELGLLPFIDYLSTVSGGGFIGSWMHGVIRNKYSGDPAAAQAELAGGGSIGYLRRHSSYLTPQLGFFSPDSWTIGTAWLRNMSLNLLYLLPFLMGIVLTVLLAGILQQRFDRALESDVARAFWVFALSAAVSIIGVNLRHIVFGQFPDLTPRLRLPDFTGRGMVGGATICILFAAYILGAFRFEPDPFLAAIFLFVLFFMLQWIGGYRLVYRARHQGANGWGLLIAIPPVCAAVTSALLWSVWKLTGAWVDPDVAWMRIALGPPMILIVWMFGAVLQIGLLGGDFPDAAREWLDRLGASVSIAITAWLGLFVLAVFGPYWLARLTLRGGLAGPVLAGGWLVSKAGGYLWDKSDKTKSGAPGDGGGTTRALMLLSRIAPVLSLAVSLLLVSLGTHLLLRALVGPVDCSVPVAASIPGWLLWLEPVQREYWCFLFYNNERLLQAVIALLGACATIVAILPLRVNINEFSMHHFDKNRLVSYYLGASREERRPNRLTGFASHDDFPISSLLPSNPMVSYLGPYPIVNCALNLNIRSELARQERRAESFIFTPRYCGFDPPRSKEDLEATRRTEDLHTEGYRGTPGYMEPAGPGLGTAMAISGTGNNPNSSKHSSRPVAFLMSILSLRLGWWLGNPRRDSTSARPGPKNALLSLLSELFSQSSSRSRYLNVSDGGQFDNLGLYELVRRRCRYIIVCDSDSDPALGVEGLGGAIRKCYADFDVEITINPEPIRLAGDRSRAHCVVGTVHYPEPEAGFAADAYGRADPPARNNAVGWLLYLKAGFTGDEPEDVEQYHAAYPAFPHEGSGDPSFGASEFDSYRELGRHVVRTTFENVAARPSAEGEIPMLYMFQDLCRKWYPATSLDEDKASNLTAQYAAFLHRISSDLELAFLDSQLFDGMPLAAQPGITPRKALYFCIELIQFMEDVYFELNFQHRADRENPAHDGWHRVFRTWAQSQAIRDAWKIAGSGFNPLFQEYFVALWRP